MRFPKELEPSPLCNNKKTLSIHVGCVIIRTVHALAHALTGTLRCPPPPSPPPAALAADGCALHATRPDPGVTVAVSLSGAGEEEEEEDLPRTVPSARTPPPPVVYGPAARPLLRPSIAAHRPQGAGGCTECMFCRYFAYFVDISLFWPKITYFSTYSEVFFRFFPPHICPFPHGLTTFWSVLGFPQLFWAFSSI